MHITDLVELKMFLAKIAGNSTRSGEPESGYRARLVAIRDEINTKINQLDEDAKDRDAGR